MSKKKKKKSDALETEDEESHILQNMKVSECWDEGERDRRVSPSGGEASQISAEPQRPDKKQTSIHKDE